MTLDETECELLARPNFTRNPFITSHALTIEAGVQAILKRHRIIWFHDRLMIEVSQPYTHFEPFDKSYFDRLASPLLVGYGRSRVNDIFASLRSTVPDLSINDHLIAFGNQADPKSIVNVWDMNELEVQTDVLPSDCVWRSPYALAMTTPAHGRLELIMRLAGNDAEQYDDVLQSIAPLIMNRKPLGIIWWVRGGTVTKILIEALHQLFPEQLAAITPQRLSGGRLTPPLNNVIGNVVIEECSLRVEDLATCILIGKHEDYFRHKYHSQAGQTINGNVHHIFSASSMASINNRRYAHGSSLITVPFSEHPKTRQAQTLSHDFYGELLAEMCRYAVKIRQQGYRYVWSSATLQANADPNYTPTKPNAAITSLNSLSPYYSW